MLETDSKTPIYEVVPSDPDVAVVSRPLIIRIVRALSTAQRENRLTFDEMILLRNSFLNERLTRLDKHRGQRKAQIARERWDLNHPALQNYEEIKVKNSPSDVSN